MLAQLQEHIRLFQDLSGLGESVRTVSEVMADALRQGGKILVAGNGGSAAEAQHFAAELVGRFQQNRRALPCLALNTDTSTLTAIGNDFGFDAVFARQVEALGRAGDVFMGISTSGNSENIIAAVKEARRAGLVSIGLLGRDGGRLAGMVDYPVVVPHQVTARIQEAHLFLLHYWAGSVEEACA